MPQTRIERELDKIEPFSSLSMRLLDCSEKRASMAIRLDSNRNDKNTMFAGSIYSVMVLAGWALARQVCAELGCTGDVVVKESQNLFLSPVRSDCTAVAELAGPPERKSSGNIHVRAAVALLDEHGDRCAELVGHYVGLDRR
jgi:thioesterase domain-containing protein